ncbi:MAG: UDP-N-acetylmuramate--L-alanine ligase [Acidimicrobiales bacterium]
MTRPAVPLDLRVPGRYHVVGVGGPGMSAIAHVLARMGHVTSGSDVRESSVLDRLRIAGVQVAVGHDPALVDGVDAVTASTAIPRSNVELRAAAAAGIPVLTRAGMLASICACARSVGVAGTHGKTTTTSMLALALVEAGIDPGFIIGGDVHEVGGGARWTGSSTFVVEADESDGTFLELPLGAAIVTNVDVDHLEHWGTFDAIVEGFDAFLAAVDGPRVVCVDDPVLARLGAKHGAITYGTDASADYRAVDVGSHQGELRFSIARRGEHLGEVRVPLRGVHNVRNATGVIALADVLGAPFAATVRALGRFGGVARRFDFRGTHDGITFVDDYAHIPTEIGAVLDAAADSGDGWKRIVAVFQPNRFRRMARLSEAYADCFGRADVVVITDIYPSGDAPIPGVTGKLVVDAVLDAHPDTRMVWLPARADLVEYLARELRDGDLCLSMGCGDVADLPSEVLAQLREGEGSSS